VIVGAGIDIVDLSDFRRRLDEALIREIFLPAEIAYAESMADPLERYAARFAAKEAVFKALGAGLAQGLRWKDVEVLREDSGRALLRLSGRAEERARELGVREMHLSITHAQREAMAVVILEGTGGDEP
jgi:holo-[acyl-carrier protein] synthase